MDLRIDCFVHPEPLSELTTWKILYMVLWTFFQHETAVAGWYGLLSPSFDHWLTSATVVFTVVSAIDLVWLYMWFYVNKKAIAALMNVASFRAMVDRLGSRPRFERIKSYFSASHVSESDEVLEIKPTDSNFRRLVKRSGYLGILLLAALPGPGLKELGILMALTPKYKRHGFALMYIGGLIKTTGTLMVYGGLHEIFEQLIRKSVS